MLTFFLLAPLFLLLPLLLSLLQLNLLGFMGLNWQGSKTLLERFLILFSANDAINVWFKVFGASLAGDFESMNHRLIEVHFRREHNNRRIGLQKHLRN